MVVNGDLLTALTSASGVPHLFMAADDNGDMKVKLANAAVTNRKVSSPPFRRERPEMEKTKFREIKYCQQFLFFYKVVYTC